MIAFNVFLRILYALLFAVLSYGFLSLGLRGAFMAVIGSILPLALMGYFGRSAYRVWNGAKAPSSTAVMAVVAVVLAIGLQWAYRELAVFGGSRLMQATAGEGTRGYLGSLRGAISIYYGDMEGQYPADLAAITNKRYLEVLPKASTVHHPVSSEVLLMTGEDYAAGRFTDTGGWYYVVGGPSTGAVGVNCTHVDARGKLWNAF